jgi:hypothetical protein
MKLVVVCAALLLVACAGSPQVVPKEDMAARDRKVREQVAQEEAARAKAADTWTGPRAELGQEVKLLGTEQVKIAGSDIFLQLVKTTWTTIETPKGEVRRGTARLLLMNEDASKMKELVVDEGDHGFGLGYRVDVKHAHEEWDDAASTYLPEVLVLVSLQ